MEAAPSGETAGERPGLAECHERRRFLVVQSIIEGERVERVRAVLELVEGVDRDDPEQN